MQEMMVFLKIIMSNDMEIFDNQENLQKVMQNID